MSPSKSTHGEALLYQSCKNLSQPISEEEKAKNEGLSTNITGTYGNDQTNNDSFTNQQKDIIKIDDTDEAT